MRRGNVIGLVLSCAFVILAAGCSAESSENLVQEAKNLGVYARMDNSLKELAVFGMEDQNVMTETIGFTFTEPIPKARAVSYFVVNVPDANISESKLFWLQDVRSARWHYFNPNDERDPKPIKSTTEPISGAIYKVAAADPSTVTGKGLLCLWLKMPMGAQDRFYAIDMRE